MLSKAKIKFVKSLQIKKYRKQEQLFVIEGAKGVTELLRGSFEITTIIGTSDYLATINPPVATEVLEASIDELEALGEFQSNETVLAIARMKPNLPLTIDPGEFALLLDDIRDPGNLGTIIRTADWYGITKIIASPETTDCYNAKVITATMGSFTRVSIFYTSLETYLSENSFRVFGAYLEGEDVHTMTFGNGGLVLIGNESHGISESLHAFVTDKITIPRYGQAESLNAAIATAIICDNIRRH
ncbi:MAG TPA: RNA methyltransferase [Chryseolinea sp.]|nr:RNA methyltransferase [Chryseolinea sp.]